MVMIITQEFSELNNIINYGDVGEFENLKDIVNSFSDKDWLIDTCRQDAHQAHTDTLAIIAKKADIYFRGIKNIYTTELFDSIVKHINNSEINTDKIVNLLFAKLPSKKEIPQHIDSGYMLNVCRRFHVPIITNKDILFTVNKEVVNMKEGVLYEINNNTPHSVINNSDSDRVHLIFDIE